MHSNWRRSHISINHLWSDSSPIISRVIMEREWWGSARALWEGAKWSPLTPFSRAALACPLTCMNHLIKRQLETSPIWDNTPVVTMPSCPPPTKRTACLTGHMTRSQWCVKKHFPLFSFHLIITCKLITKTIFRYYKEHYIAHYRTVPPSTNSTPTAVFFGFWGYSCLLF